MPQNIGGSTYITQIPLISDNADILTALRLYHYGATSGPTSTISANAGNGIEGYLSALESSKISKAPIVVPTSADLNTYTSTGYYSQPSTANAIAGTNYPSLPLGTPHLGLLVVVTDTTNSITYQTYYMADSPAFTMSWRSKVAGTWNAWTYASDITHNHDATYSSISANGTKPTIVAGYSSYSPTTTPVGGNTTKKIFITNETALGTGIPWMPAGTTPAEGDLWFW